jgi:hypothetical protein
VLIDCACVLVSGIASTVKWVEVRKLYNKRDGATPRLITIVVAGRTSTGMIVSSIIASIDRSDDPLQMALEQEDQFDGQLNSSINLDDISEETIYKRGARVVGSCR